MSNFTIFCCLQELKLNWHIVTKFEIFHWIAERGLESCQVALESDAIQLVLNQTEKYDVILTEQFNQECTMGIAWKLNAPVIGMCSSVLLPWNYDRSDNPLIPSYIPNVFMRTTDEMSFFERIENWIETHGFRFWYR